MPAIAEIAGSIAFWAWLRLEKSPSWIVPEMVSLVLCAFRLMLIDSAVAGRAYAAYGGEYIASSQSWLWIAEGIVPDRWGASGVAICAAVIFGAPG